MRIIDDLAMRRPLALLIRLRARANERELKWTALGH